MNVEDWPVHQPECYDAPIPGRQWYSGCTDDRPRVNPATGRCLECGGEACRICGKQDCPEHPGRPRPDFDPRIDHPERYRDGPI